MKTEPRSFYEEQIKTVEAQLVGLTKRSYFWGYFKLGQILTAFILLIVLFSSRQFLAMGLFFSLFAAFVVSAFIHEGILKKIRHNKTVIRVNRDELDILDFRFPSTIDDGVVFMDTEHKYGNDLDIFGPRSLFHFVNRTVTAMGRRQLADYLSARSSVSDIRERQEAVKELAEKNRFRCNLRVHGLEIDDTAEKLDGLRRFFAEPFFLLERKWIIALIHVFPIVSLSLLALLIVDLPMYVPLFFILTQMVINIGTARASGKFYRLTSGNYKILRAYSGIIKDIEDEPFTAPGLLSQKKNLLLNGKFASRHIRRLSTLFEWFETRNSDVLIFILNSILCWDLHCIYRIEKWKKETAHVVEQWLAVIARVEAFSSFGALAYNNPSWTFPVIHDGGHVLKANEAGHPLISPRVRVNNDIHMEHSGSIRIITGPNMAGKSTFLRTVGVNAVLALAGAPVCARNMEISPMTIFTSMKSTDSLDRHLSLFYAELQRLKLILDGIRGGEPVFFMIDEMLKGTNALDRQKGSIVLLNQLIKAGATGIVATHDLELTRIENLQTHYQNGDVANFHFDGYVEEDKLLFDYKLKPGICESFNALALMKTMGIDV